MFTSLAVAVGLASAAVAKQAFPFNHQPHRWEDGQTGYNNCGTKDSKDARCQTLLVNSVQDFCLWGAVKPNSGVGDVEHDVVSWCNKAGHGGRLMPEGTITGAHMVITPHYLQLTGRANLKLININGNKDGGGELDPHGADGNGNPAGGLVYTTAFGGKQPQQIQEWQMFLENDRFCIKMCRPGTDNQDKNCPHVYDEQGCFFNEPGNYDKGTFDQCAGDDVLPPGLYPYRGQATKTNNYDSWSTWYQGVNPTPAAHPAGKTSKCTKYSTVPYDTYSGTKVTKSTKAPKSSSTRKPKPTSSTPKRKPTSSK